MNFKSISSLLVFTFISISVLCDTDLDDIFEGLETYEELENLINTNEERGSNRAITVNISATYACDTNSPFTNITSTDNAGGQAFLTFLVTRTGLKCTSLTIGRETGFYVATRRAPLTGNEDIPLFNAKTVILRVNGKEILTQTATLNDTQCAGAKVILYDTITQNQNGLCNTANGILNQTTTTAVFEIKKRCESKCTGQITYIYTPGLTK